SARSACPSPVAVGRVCAATVAAGYKDRRLVSLGQSFAAMKVATGWISSRTGGRFTYKNLGTLISKITFRTLGVDVSPHLFRTAAASTAAAKNTGVPPSC